MTKHKKTSSTREPKAAGTQGCKEQARQYDKDKHNTTIIEAPPGNGHIY